MPEYVIVEFLWNNNKIDACSYLFSSVRLIISKNKISKREFDFVIKTLSLCDLVYKTNKDNKIMKDIKKSIPLYYLILFNKTVDK